MKMCFNQVLLEVEQNNINLLDVSLKGSHKEKMVMVTFRSFKLQSFTKNLSRVSQRWMQRGDVHLQE